MSPTKKPAAVPEGTSASALISQRIADLGDWRGDLLGHLRALVTAAVPDVVEEWKWETPVWSKNGIICTGEAYKKAVKLTFPKGAALKDPKQLFNSSLEGNVRRAIDIHEGDTINDAALKTLFAQAAALNSDGAKKTTKKR